MQFSKKYLVAPNAQVFLCLDEQLAKAGLTCSEEVNSGLNYFWCSYPVTAIGSRVDDIRLCPPFVKTVFKTVMTGVVFFIFTIYRIFPNKARKSEAVGKRRYNVLVEKINSRPNSNNNASYFFPQSLD